MATKQLLDNLHSLFSRTSRTTDQPVGHCFILELPAEVLQKISEYLNLRDLHSLSRTCRRFSSLINNDDFWIHRIRCQFSPALAQFYTYELFQESEINDVILQAAPSGLEHTRPQSELDYAAVRSATYFTDSAIEQRAAKMFVSKTNFRYQSQYFQFRKPSDSVNIPLMKLVYLYLIDRKRLAIVDMDVVHRGDQHLVERADENSLKGRVIALQSVCWLEITGRFQQTILPGKYQVTWRMKNHAQHSSIPGETEFITVPSRGKMSVHKMSDNDFRNYFTEHQDRWFIVPMGEIHVYEPSIVFVAIRNWHNGWWKSGITWDCIELIPVA